MKAVQGKFAKVSLQYLAAQGFFAQVSLLYLAAQGTFEQASLLYLAAQGSFAQAFLLYLAEKSPKQFCEGMSTDAAGQGSNGLPPLQKRWQSAYASRTAGPQLC